MTQIMTPPKTTTAGQIDKAVASYRALLEKHSGEFNSEAVQTVLGQPELISEQFAVFRRHVEAMSNLIVRRVTVNRNRTPQEALDATGRKQYMDREVVESMPMGDGEQVEIVFFKPHISSRYGFITNDEQEKEFELRGLKPADPISVAAVNEADPAFADQKPHRTHWKNADGKWCFAEFGLLDGGRRVSVGQYPNPCFGGWLAGVRK